MQKMLKASWEFKYVVMKSTGLYRFSKIQCHTKTEYFIYFILIENS